MTGGAEFLPVHEHGRRVYAGSWKRLGAGSLDALVLLPVWAVAETLGRLSIGTAVALAVAGGLAYPAYLIVLHARYGATLGKMAVGVRVTRPDGTPISARQAVLRSSVDLAFSLALCAAQVAALRRVDAGVYLGSGWIAGTALLGAAYPAWHAAVSLAGGAWYFGGFVTLLFNRRKRAIHDFIAGTVVVNRHRARSGPPARSPQGAP